MPKKTTHELCRGFRNMEFRPETLNEADRTIEVDFTQGARGKRYGWVSDYYEELEVSDSAMRMDRINNGAPFLDAHNARFNDSVLGVIESAWIEKGVGKAKIRFDDTELAERRLKSIRNGILKNVSVGYDVHEYRELEEKSIADGLPIYRAVDWEPMEISLVPVGFDDTSKVRSSETGTKNPVSLISNEQVTEGEPAEQTREVEMPEIKEVENQIDEAAIKAEGVKAERARSAKIEKLGKALGLEQRAKELIESGESFESANDILVELKAERSKEVKVDAKSKVEVGATDKSKKLEGMERALLFKTNKQRYADEAKDNPYSGASFLQMVRHIGGSSVEFMDDRKLIKRAMSNTTGDFPILLSNVANKTLRDEFTYLGNNYEGLISRTEAPNFKPIERDRLGDASDLLPVAEAEDYQMSSMGESKETYRVGKYGRLFPITFEALIDDDLGAFSRVAKKIAVAAQRKERDLVWDTYINNPLMSDGNAWFSAAHGNLAGTPSALSEASLEEGYIAMMAQKGDALEGESSFLNVPPAYLIVAPKNRVTGQKLLASITPATSGDVNPFSGDLQLIIEPKLEGLNSGNSWFLSAAPGAIDTMELAYLRGEGGLVIEELPELKNDTISWKSRLVAGAAPIEYRGVYKNAGA